MMIRGERWRRNNAKWLKILNGVKRNFRKILSVCCIIAYAAAYLSIESNSLYVPLGEVTYIDRQYEPKSVYESHLFEIKETARSISRVYNPTHPKTWCVDSVLKYDQIPRQPMGLCYLRIPHSAGATLRGINMRIARNFGQRHGMDTCIRHDSTAKGMDYPERDTKSYLWTFVRDPTHRAMSAVGSMLSYQLIPSSKKDFYDKLNETDTIVADKALHMLRNYTDLKNGIVSEGRGGFQLQYMMQTYIPENYVNKPLHPEETANRQGLAQKISSMLKRYDFVGVVERFDESLVAMQLLLGLETSDILYFAVNRKEHWRKAKRRRNQFECRDSFDWEVDVLGEPLITEYVTKSKEWYANNYGDYLLYHAASQSLDRTIMKIGLDHFSQELTRFRELMKRAHEECIPKFPCSLNGTLQIEEAERDCQGGGNIGCGYQCLNDLTIE